MNRVFNYDKFKLQKSKSWWICTLISIILTVIGIFTISYVFKNSGKEYFEFKSFYNIIFSTPNFIYLIIVAIFIGNDFKTATIKNVSSKGIKRCEIVLSKLVWNFILALVYVVSITIAGIVSVILFTNTPIKSSDLVEILKLTSISIIRFFAYASIYTLIGFMAKSIGVTIAIGIALDACFNITFKLIDVLILKSNILYNMSPGFMESILSNVTSSKEITIYILSMFMWVIVCSLLSIYIFKKQDIK